MDTSQASQSHPCHQDLRVVIIARYGSILATARPCAARVVARLELSRHEGIIRRRGALGTR